MKPASLRWAAPFLALALASACHQAGESELEAGGYDTDSDSATLRRQAMNEWYYESSASADLRAGPWSPAYRRFILEAARRERLRWGELMPGAALAKPSVSGTLWTNLGPTQAHELKNGSITLNVTDSGRVRTIIPDGLRIFVATAGGGVWRTDDGGGVWTPITESLGTLSCGSLAMDPSNHDTLYLGLGDPYDGTGIGFVKSVDGGTTWGSPVYLGDSTITPQVLVDPAVPSIVLAATNKGLYRSTDAGVTFTQVSLATGQGEAPYVWSLDSTGGHGLVLSLEALSSATSGTTDGQIWTSADDGATWTRASGVTKSGGVGRITVAAAPSNRQILYAMAAVPNSTSASDLADIFKSTDGGHSWTALGITHKRYTNANTESARLGGLLNGQGWYDQLVIVSPTDPNVAYFGGALLLARTSDGGSSYTQVSNWLAQYNLPYVHADFHAGAFDADGDLLVGTDGGVFLSTDGGATFTDALNVGIVTHLLYSVGSSPQSRDAVIGGMQDNGTRVREGATSVWNEYLGGDGFGSNINQANPQLMLGSLYYDRIYKSTDGGLTFASASSGISESNNGSSAPFITRIVAWDGSSTGNEVYTFSNTKVYRSTNYAGSWSVLGTAPLSSGVIRGIGVAPSDANVVGVVASGGRVFLSSDAGSTWATVASGQTPDATALPNSRLSLSDVRFDPSDPSIVYVASVAPYSDVSHLWKSTDFGATWTSIDGFGSGGNGLPAGVPVNILKPDPQGGGAVLYAGTHLGVYRSTDGGASWTRFGAGMPLVSVTDLYISPDTTLVRAATFGRGFWELGGGSVSDDFSLGASPSSVTVAQGASGATTLNTTVTSGAAQQVTFSAGGLPAGASASFNPTTVTAGGSATLTLTAAASTPAGTYSVTVTGTGDSTTHSTTVSLTVTASDFSIAASPSSVEAVQGGSVDATISTAVTSGGTQSVALSASGVPAGASASFAPATLNAGDSSTLTLAAGSAAPGTYTIQVTGAGTSATHAVDVTFTITAPAADDFALGASPSDVSTPQGGSVTSTISTTVTSGSAQTVTLSASGLPAGASASFAPASVTAGAASTLTLTAGAATPTGTYAVTVTGTGTSATHSTTVNFTVTADFSMSASPSAVSVTQGGSVDSTITTTVTAGGAQAITLSASGLPSGTTATFNPATLNAGEGATLTLATGGSTPAGTYTVTVTGTGATATHTTTVDLTVQTAGGGGGETALVNGQPLGGLAGAAGSQQFFRLDVPAGATNLRIGIAGGSGDADLYVKLGSLPTTTSYDCRPYLSGNNETCSVDAPQTGSYYVMINGFADYADVTLTGYYSSSTDPAVLPNGVPYSGISGAQGSNQYWKMVSVPDGQTVTISISGSTSRKSDADLYVRQGAIPTLSTYDCRPYVTGSNETCTLTNTTGAAADYYILINGYTAYSGVTLSGSF